MIIQAVVTVMDDREKLLIMMKRRRIDFLIKSIPPNQMLIEKAGKGNQIFKVENFRI